MITCMGMRNIKVRIVILPWRLGHVRWAGTKKSVSDKGANSKAVEISYSKFGGCFEYLSYS